MRTLRHVVRMSRPADSPSVDLQTTPGAWRLCVNSFTRSTRLAARFSIEIYFYCVLLCDPTEDALPQTSASIFNIQRGLFQSSTIDLLWWKHMPICSCKCQGTFKKVNKKESKILEIGVNGGENSRFIGSKCWRWAGLQETHRKKWRPRRWLERDNTIHICYLCWLGRKAR